jgi:hypothetical protein
MLTLFFIFPLSFILSFISYIVTLGYILHWRKFKTGHVEPLLIELVAGSSQQQQQVPGPESFSFIPPPEPPTSPPFSFQLNQHSYQPLDIEVKQGPFFVRRVLSRGGGTGQFRLGELLKCKKLGTKNEKIGERRQI